VSHQSLTWGTTLRSEKVILSLLEKLWTEKYPSSRFNHLSTTSTSISPSNNGISKFTCTLKGVAWPLDEDASPVGSHRRICEGSHANVVHHFIPLSCKGFLEQHFKRISYSIIFLFISHGFFPGSARQILQQSIGLSPNFLYPDLVGDMHEEK
jgi:hypothetical protein